MKLVEHLPLERKGLENHNVLGLFWIAAGGYVSGVLILILLQRLGMPQSIALSTTLFGIIVGTLIFGFVGKTMLNTSFFFANRSSSAFMLGISGMTDWATGSFWFVFLSMGLAGQMVLAPSLMFGVMLLAILFSSAFQKSGVATLAGFFAWRSQSQLAGLAVLIVTVPLLLAFVVAEFQVARSTVLLLTNISEQTAVWILLALVAFCCIAGGWLSLLLVNGTLALWMIVSTFVPAISIGLFPTFLRSSELGTATTLGLPLLSGDSQSGLLIPDTLLVSGSLSELIVVICALAFGFSVLPHIFSRTALNGSSRNATESLGWTALVLMAVFAATPLSITLITTSADITSAQVLAGNPVLQILPYLVLFFAAFNAMCACVLSVSAAVVRAFRRSRRQDPGEQSMFTTRLLILLILGALGLAPIENLPSVSVLFFGAVCLSASALFFPFAASVFLPNTHAATHGLAVLLAGTAFVYAWQLLNISMINSTAGGMAVSVIIILLGWVVPKIFRLNIDESHLQLIRQPEAG